MLCDTVEMVYTVCQVKKANTVVIGVVDFVLYNETTVYRLIFMNKISYF